MRGLLWQKPFSFWHKHKVLFSVQNLLAFGKKRPATCDLRPLAKCKMRSFSGKKIAKLFCDSFATIFREKARKIPNCDLDPPPYLIFVTFFTPTHFEAWKFYTQKCLICDKSGLATNRVNHHSRAKLHIVYKITHCVYDYTLRVVLQILHTVC